MMARYEYLVPLENLFLTDIKYFKIGEVKILKITESFKKKLMAKYRKDLKKAPKKLKELYREIIPTLINHLSAGALVTVNSNSKYTTESYDKVLKEIQLAVDILNFYGSYIRGRCAPAVIALQGRFDSRRCNFFCLNQPILPGWQLIKDHPYIFHYELNKNSLKRIKKVGWKKLLNLLKNPQQKDRYLIKSIKWFSQAMIEEDKDIKLVKLFICLESILIFGKEPKGQNLGERCALLIGKDFNDKLYIEKSIKECYRLRGDIVHEGKKNISENKLFYLEKIALDVIIKILKNNKIKNKNDLGFYLKKLKYEK